MSFCHKPLFRGDSIPDSISDLNSAISSNNLVKYYLTEGLTSKSLIKANYDDLNLGLEYLVAAHIGHQPGTKEELLYKRSIFISLSEDESTSERFMTYGRNVNLVSTTFDHAKFVMWKIVPVNLEETKLGVYDYKYMSDSTNIEGFFKAILGSKPFPNAADLAIHAVIQAHKEKPTSHYAVLIDAAKFLEPLVGRGQLYADAFTNAKRDKEWLLLPADPMNIGPGFTGRFVLNAETVIYKCLTEVS